MVDFNKMVEEQSPPDLTIGYRTVDSSAVGDLFSNLGKVGADYMAAKEVSDKSAIDAEILRQADNYAFGVAGAEEDVPTELRDGMSRVAYNMNASRRLKGSKKSLTYAKAVSLSKDLRFRFPGYESYIEQKTNAALGFNPRQMLVSTAQAEQDAYVTERQAFYSEPSNRFLTGNKGYVDEATYARDKMIVAKRQEVIAEFEHKKKSGEMRLPDIERYANQAYSDVMTSMSRQLNLQGYLDGTVPLGEVKPEELVNGMRVLRGKMTAEFQSLYSNVGNGITTEDIDKLVTKLQSRLDEQMKLISAGQYDVAASLALVDSLDTKVSIRKLNERSGGLLARRDAMKEALGDENKANEWMTNEIQKLAKGGDTSTYFANLLATGAENPAKATEHILSSEDIADKNKAFRSTYEETFRKVKEVTNPQTLNKFVQQQYNPENIRRQLAVLEKGDVAFLNFISRPDVVDHLSKHSKDSLNTFVSGMENALQGTDSFIKVRDALKQSRVKLAVDKDGTLIFEGLNMSWSEVLQNLSNPNLIGNEQEFKDLQEKLTSGSTAEELKTLQSATANIQYAYQKAGMNYTESLSRLFQQDIQQIQEEKASDKPQKQSSLENVQITPTSISGNEMVEELYTDTRSVDIAARTIAGEARGESSEGRQAIGEVLRNRALASGKSIAEEARKAWQFSVWNKNDPNRSFVENIDDSNPQYQTAMQDFLSSANSDITKGATHYYNPSVVTPDWADVFVETARIGNHRFGYLREGDPYRASS